MAPRRYRIDKRAENAAATRRKIVAATHALHQEQGIAETTMKQIASRAGVGIGTVYNHFPRYEDAVQACGELTFTLTPPPQATIFDGVARGEDRVRLLAKALFAFYRACPSIDKARWDSGKIETLAKYMHHLDDHVAGLLRVALADKDLGKRARAVAMALLDFDSHKQLVRQGLSTENAAAAAADLVLTLLAAPKTGGISRRLPSHLKD
jgi:AcrR family transcriptional regulator